MRHGQYRGSLQGPPRYRCSLNNTWFFGVARLSYDSDPYTVLVAEAPRGFLASERLMNSSVLQGLFASTLRAVQRDRAH